MLKFEWDAPKSTANLRKHGVSFEAAATVFGDPLALTFEDPDHSIREARLITIGQSYQDLLLAIRTSNAARRSESSAHARPAKNERTIYGQG